MKYFIIAGERSGDMHGSRLASEILRNDRRAELVGTGGDLMQKEGVRLVKHYKDFSLMGFWEVITHLRRTQKAIKEIKKAILSEKPDVLVLIDFAGMNLRLAKFAKKNNIKTCYYISPKIWAWKESRFKKIEKYVDKMLVIMPFEKDYYQKKGFEVEYVGNPLMDGIKAYEFDNKFQLPENQVNIAVLPGSRPQEIHSSVKVVTEIAKQSPKMNFVIAAVDNVDKLLYQPYETISNAQLVFNKTYEILKQSNAAIVTSGTATLETALLNCPQVVVYRANPISIFIARKLVKINWISLVNLIAQKTVVKELIQEEYNAENVLSELNNILKDHHYCATMLEKYQEIRSKIGYNNASREAARAVVEFGEG